MADVCFFLFSLNEACAQQPMVSVQVPGYKVIDILRAGKLGKNNEYQYASVNVAMRQAGTYFYCDSVSLNTITGLMEAFGRVHINDQDSVHTYSDYLRYKGKERTAFLKGNVKLTDGTGTLTTEQLDYDMNTSIGIYKNGGKLVNGKTVLTSREGIYYGDTRDITFFQKVLLVDPQYRITTDSLLYNTSTRIATFVVPTEINSGDNRKIITSDGSYNMDTRQAYFGSRPTIIDSTTHLVADEVAYDDRSGFGEARGNAVLKDTAQGIVVIANNIKTNKHEAAFLATVSPVAILAQDGDSTYIASDTIYSAKLSNRIAGIDYKHLTTEKEERPLVDSTNYNIQDEIDPEVKPHLDKDILPENNKPVIPVPGKRIEKTEKAAVPETGSTDMAKLLGVERTDTIVKPPLPTDSVSIKPEHEAVAKKTESTGMAKLLGVARDTLLPPVATQKDTLVNSGKTTPSAIDKTLAARKDTTLKSNDRPAFGFPATEIPADTATGKTDDKDRFLEFYYNVRIYNDSLQAVCDSMFYSAQDSVFRLFRDPVVWTSSNNQFSQMTGDTIYVFTQKRKPRQINVWKNAMMLSQSYYDSTHVLGEYYNQLSGTYLYAYFTNGQLDSMQAKNNAQSIYYLLDDGDRYLGVNQQQSDVLDFYFKDKQLQKIVGRQDIKGTTYPMRQVDHNSIRLRGYRLYNERRPKSKYDLFAPAPEIIEAPAEEEEAATPAEKTN